MVDREKLNKKEREMFEKVLSFGFSETDAEIIAESLISKKSCSWINNDPVDDFMLSKFRAFLAENNYNLSISVEYLPTRNKYIWQIKNLDK
jgi:hypothetical protein